jgi:hypothetical protein
MPQAGVQVPEPIVPQVVVQATGSPGAHVLSSSTSVSQSSSRLLHISPGGVHEPQAQDAEQTREPMELHVVVHEPALPATQAKPLSGVPSQSSSAPLQASAGGVHDGPVGREQLDVQGPVPVVPQVVEQVTVAPATQV